MEQWMTIDDAAEHLGVTKRTIQRRIQDGAFEKRKANGKSEVLLTVDDNVSPADANLVAQLSSEVDFLRQQNENLMTNDTELVAQLKAENEYLKQQLDHQTQLMAMTQKNIASLTDQVSDKDQLIEDLRHRPSLWNRVKSGLGLSR